MMRTLRRAQFIAVYFCVTCTAANVATIPGTTLRTQGTRVAPLEKPPMTTGVQGLEI